MILTLKYNGTEKTLAEWGIRAVTRNRQSQTASVVTFEQVVPSIADAPMFPAEAKLEFYKQPDDDDSNTKFRWFVGWVAQTPHSQRSAREVHSYVAKDAFWYFERLVFQRLWYRQVDPADPQSSIVGGYVPWFLLNNGTNGEYMTTAEMLSEIIAFVNQAAVDEGLGAIMQADANFPAVKIPKDERKNIMSLEAVRLQLRWLADATTWFDYNTEPPTLYCLRRTDQTAVDVALNDEIKSAEFTPRDDLVVPGVILKYERTNSDDGHGRLETVIDAFPVNTTDRRFDVLPITIQLQGYATQYQKAEVTTRPVSQGASGFDSWLMAKLPALNDPRVDFSTFAWTLSTYEFADGSVYDFSLPPSATNVPPADDMLNELVSGTITPGNWEMRGGNGTVSVDVKTVIAKGFVTYDKNEGNGEVTKVVNKQISVRFNLTNCASGTFRRMTSWAEADPIPEGLAQTLYEAYSVKHYEGNLTFHGEAAPDSPSLGNVVNVTGGRAEWETMRALVQAEREDIDNGTKSITVGPPAFLTASDLVSLLFVTRTRATWTAPQSLETGEATANEQENPEFAPGENSTQEGGAEGVPKFHVTSAAWNRQPGGAMAHQGGFGFFDVDMTGTNRKLQMRQAASEANAPTAGAEVTIDLFDANGKVFKLRAVRIVSDIVFRDADGNAVSYLYGGPLRMIARTKQVLMLAEDAEAVAHDAFDYTQFPLFARP